MDCERLIELVQERRSLWDPKEKNYHVRSVQKKLWQEVANEINESVDSLKKRWRGLRDTFRKELKKEVNSKSESGGDGYRKSSWPFFSLLYFLADTIHLGNTENSISAVEEEEESQTHSDSFYEPHHHSSSTQCTILATPWTHDDNEPSTANGQLRQSPLKKKRKFSRDECSYYDETFQSKNGMYLEERRKVDKEADQHFLNSLLPFLNDIPQNRKLVVRTKIMEVLIEELNGRENSSHQLSHRFASPTAPSTPASTIVSDCNEN
ncbi:transcription factor Adf-1 [Halyomorpha halys]|uniref:transcription factor Adf-1 n=1 Tax=Halyomorpha halys TaxID=286706 RepID=UPI0006D506A0|nr:transcription factor Adf-1-like [Halyomorpha halys]